MPRPPLRRALCAAAVAALAIGVAGCKTTSGHTSSVPLHYDQRHPITVGYQPVGIVVHADPSTRGLHPEDATEIAALARQYRNSGQGAIHLQAPTGPGLESVVHASSTQIREILRREGVDPSVLSVHTYRAEYAGPAAMKLVFYRYAAEAGPCGNWPENVAHNPANTSHYDFGCSTQRNLAAMVEDPRDLLGPRGHGPRDAMRRATVQDKYRKGEDTATVYTDEGAQVSEVGGQ
ncbi:CpaD family pilus assembly protein [Tepidamorphus sp. 3E244]|uniref:CpaD family pilus assembly protein n=1 Tax=Tepidamorphus sp. 3E244 TaxID=3385498 RepID=UPI0038FC2816